MRLYYVYILKCSDDSYYVGMTNDIIRRLGEHQSGSNMNSYTYSRRPVELVFSTVFQDARRALDKEKQIKGWSRKKKEALINEHWSDLVQLSKKKFSQK